jgi:hypothetical protein
MHYGAKFPSSLKKEVIKAAEKDEWYKESGKKSERAVYILNFIDLVKKYKNGVVTKTPYVGLFEQLDKKLNGKPKIKKPRNLVNQRYSVEAYESGGHKHVEVNIPKHDYELKADQLEKLGNWFLEAAKWKIGE